MPITKVLCLENTYDLNRGIPLSKEYISEICTFNNHNSLCEKVRFIRVGRLLPGKNRLITHRK